MWMNTLMMSVTQRAAPSQAHNGGNTPRDDSFAFCRSLPHTLKMPRPSSLFAKDDRTRHAERKHIPQSAVPVCQTRLSCGPASAMTRRDARAA